MEGELGWVLVEMRSQRDGPPEALRVSVGNPLDSQQDIIINPPSNSFQDPSIHFDSPPPYEWMERPRSQLTGTPEWLAGTSSRSMRHSPGWSRNPRPLSTAPHSPASHFRTMEASLPSDSQFPTLRLAHSPLSLHELSSTGELNGNLLKIDSSYATGPRTHSNRTINQKNSIGGTLPNTSRSQTQPLIVHREYLNGTPPEDRISTSTFERRGARQASFMAAIAGGTKQKIKQTISADAGSHTRFHRRESLRAAMEEKEKDEDEKVFQRVINPNFENNQSKRKLQIVEIDSLETAGSTVHVTLRSPPARGRRHRRNREGSSSVRVTSKQTSRSLLEPPPSSEMPTLLGESQSVPASPMRRPRPKSYVLATSSSFPLTIENDEHRRVPSFPSVESLERRRPGAPHPPATQRITRFIQLFSHHDNQKSSEEKQSQTKRHAPLKRSRTTGPPANRVPLSPPIPVQASAVYRQGLLQHQEHPIGVASRRVRPSQWEQRWAVLAGKTLHLCKQLSSYISDKTKEKIYSVPADSVSIEVSSAIIDIAYDALKRDGQKHVVRVVTLQHREHLLQTQNEEDMLSWIAALQKAATLYVEEAAEQQQRPLSTTTHSEQSLASCSSSSEGVLSGGVSVRHVGTGTASAPPLPSIPLYPIRASQPQHPDRATQQLIMHRYKAKSSQLGSPMAKRVSDGHHEGQAGTSASTSTDHEAPPSGNGQCANETATTPKTLRKGWKKPKASKQTSAAGPPSYHDRDKPNNALGLKIGDCQTAGNGDLVPLIVRLCVRVVEAHGMETVGIYRIPGNTAAVNALKETLNQGFDNLDFNDSRWKDVNVVSSLLKMFLRKLPEPLLTDKLYPFFIDASRMINHAQRLHKLRNLLRKLPRAHYDTLKHLMTHLRAVTMHSEVNKMECRNLALMFGPSIVRPSDDNMATMVTHMSDQCKIIESFINYYIWMFDDAGTVDDAVPEMIQTEPVPPPGGAHGLDAGPAGVSTTSFNDMHNLIRRANEEQAADMMKEQSRAGKIKNILNVRRNSQRKKEKGRLKIESTAPAAMNPLPSANVLPSRPGNLYTVPPPIPTSSALDTIFCGSYQERDIDAEIASRQTVSPLASTVDQSPSLESSLGSLPDTSRTAPELSERDRELDDIERRKRRQESLSSARRIFIAGSAAAAEKVSNVESVDSLVSDTQQLHVADSPVLEVLSEATREKIRRFQSGATFTNAERSRRTDTIARLREARERSRETASLGEPRLWGTTGAPLVHTKQSPSREDALSFSSSLSTASSLPLSAPMTVNVPLGTASSDYASEDVSPCTRQESASPKRPRQLALGGETRCEQKIKMRNRAAKDPKRRHTLTDMDILRDSTTFGKLARWLGIRKSSPDVREEGNLLEEKGEEKTKEETVARKVESNGMGSARSGRALPPAITRTSPAELTPASEDEQL
ncbi:unnamed protein product, partial [Mesorhabditis belari]|uniref:Uncharacterized protein n=1 Tax=Mesorhabditis belari TaxID=2138241 RepID=A0AAF3E921_9BILA